MIDILSNNTIKKLLFFNVNLILILSFSPVKAEYTFPVPLILSNKIYDKSIPSDWWTGWQWVYIGQDTQIIEPADRSWWGCPGEYPNGAPGRTNCTSTYPATSQYYCPSVARDLHNGSVVTGSLNIPTYATSFSDGYNPDSCELKNIGNIPVLTRSNELYIAGGRWECPSGYDPVDIDGDGNAYNGDALAYNPEACGKYKCPDGSALAYAPDDPNASQYQDSFGYVCVGSMPEKQPNDCKENTPNPKVGNPIIVATGNKHQVEIDYQSRKQSGLSFKRYYNSNADLSANMGVKWRHEYSQQIMASDLRFNNSYVYQQNNKIHYVTSVTSSGEQVLVYRNNGQAFIFHKIGSEWKGDPDNPDTLTETIANNVHTGWVYKTSKNVIEHFNVKGHIVQSIDQQGQSQHFVYDLPLSEGGDDNSETLDKVVDSFGNYLTFNYNDKQLITQMVDSEGKEYTYIYAENGNLTEVIYPDDTLSNVDDNPTRVYHYENASFPHRLTGITDENNTRYVTWNYDSQGRAVSSELSDGKDKQTLLFNTDGSVKVTSSLGKETTYHFTNLFGVKKVTHVTGHPTENCTGANKEYTYDNNGFLASHTDWNGHVTTYNRDATGLELSRTEAVGTPDERTITTEWHPDFRQPVKITQSGKITEYSYDAQGRLLTQTTRSAQ